MAWLLGEFMTTGCKYEENSWVRLKRACFPPWSPSGRLRTYLVYFKEVGRCALSPKYDVSQDECSRELKVHLQSLNLLTRFNLVHVSMTKTHEFCM